MGNVTNTPLVLPSTQIPSPAPSSTNTKTPSPTPTPSQTPTATFIPVTPVWSGTQMPESAVSITLDNLNRMVPLSRWGNGNITKMQYSADGAFLIIASTTGLYFYETKGYSLADYIDTNVAILDMAFARDSPIIAALSYDGIHIYNFRSKELIKTIKVNATSVAISSDGEKIATGSVREINGYIQLWDLHTDDPVQSFQETGWIYQLVFSPDNRHLASGAGSLFFWDINGTLIGEYGTDRSGHSTESLAFSQDGSLLAQGTQGKTIEIWNVLDNGQLSIFRQLTLKNYGVENLSISPDRNTLAVATQNGIYLWDINRGEQISTLTTDLSRSRVIAWANDNKTLAVSLSNIGVEIWDVRENGPIKKWGFFTGELYTLDWAPLGDMIAVGTGEKIVHLLEMQTGDILHSLQNLDDVNDIDFSPKGEYFAVGGNDDVTIWGTDGHIVSSLHGVLSEWKTHAKFSPDNSWLIANITTKNPEDETEWGHFSWRMFQTDGWTPIQSWRIEDELVIDLELSPDGRFAFVAVSNNFVSSIEIWDLQLGKKVHTIQDASSAIWSLAISPDGRKLAALSRYPVGMIRDGEMSESVILWDTQNWSTVWRSDDLSQDPRKGLPGYFPNDIAWSSDGNLIAVGTSDGYIKILKADNGEISKNLSGHTMWVTGVQFSPDGTLLSSISLDGTIRLWGIR